MRIQLVCFEDGITACGFRKIAATFERLNPDTRVCFVSTGRYRSLGSYLRGSYGGRGRIDPETVDEIAQGLVDADLVGLSSMTGYADLTRAVARRIRELSKRPLLVWGGVHPIMHPEDAIRSDVDAICTGEGEFAVAELLDRMKRGVDFTTVRNFWFKRGDEVVRNPLLPLMTSEEMESLPFPKYGEGEWIHRPGHGFVPLDRREYLRSTGLGYIAIWTIGCPLHCTFCGNTTFIENDPRYRRLRHPSPRYAIEEIKSVRRKLPHLSSVSFMDDSFLAVPLRELREFARLWKEEVGLPFGVYGVIPNYVRRDKFQVLTDAGMTRARMGIQSGSRRILDFYRRPTPPERIEAAADVMASFSPRRLLPPIYDVIVDNPLETRRDVLDTLELLYRLRRPFTLFVYSLRVIPNTELERQILAHGVDVEEISSGYAEVPPRWANLLLYLLVLWRPPRWLFDRLLRRVEASGDDPREYPVLGAVLRALYVFKWGIWHLRFMEFGSLPGGLGYLCWRLGLIRRWRRRFLDSPSALLEPTGPPAAPGDTTG